jgi:hypothetical protein
VSKGRDNGQSGWLHDWAKVLVAAGLAIPTGLIVAHLTGQWPPHNTPGASERSVADAVSEPAIVPGPVQPPQDARTLPEPRGPLRPVDEPKVRTVDPEPVPAEARVEPKPPPTGADPDAAAASAVPPRTVPKLVQSGCPAKQAALTFELASKSNAFQSLSGVELVTLHDCERETGAFSTLVSKEFGPLSGLGGTWSADELRMQFGYRSDNDWGDIVCTIVAHAVKERRYAGRIACNASGRRGSAEASAPVEVGL